MPTPTYDTALTAIRERLSARSAAHCEAVADTAAHLAEVYGVDVEAARLAGLLHDWSRDEEKDALVDEAVARGIDPGTVGRSVPYLLHAQLGALRIAEEFPGIAPEVLSAIERHTTGAADMSELDIIIYIADMIEPARTFNGVEELRAAVGTVPLRELFALAYETSLHHLVDKRRRLHPVTVDVWNSIVGERT